ncbi:Ribonuclease BN [Candidatus Sulfopaludibacter sp. SbA3]|nr:Ribonuclease BN [Candidatus Sulfopaludibacter sp. SbA3]
METEAHVYALAVAASVLLSFYPFLMVMISLCRDVLHSSAAVDAIHVAIGDFFSGKAGVFINHNLQSWMVPKLHLFSMLLLLFTANGIFEPLEVALNRAWGVTQNRSYLKNQLISLGLIFVCGALALLSVALTGWSFGWVSQVTNGHKVVLKFILEAIFKIAAVPVSIIALFLVYWLLPNRKIEPARVAGVSIWVGLALEGLKYLNLLLAPWLDNKFEHEYNIFRYSVTILIWSFLAALVVLAGAHWTARHDTQDPLAEQVQFGGEGLESHRQS